MVSWLELCYSDQNVQVEAIQHFLYGIAIDEGYTVSRANTLAWDVLYPEVSRDITSTVSSCVLYHFQLMIQLQQTNCRSKGGKHIKILFSSTSQN